MPKDRRVNSSSFDRSMVSPYSCSSKISDRKSSKSSLPHVGDEKEWDEVRCPICMEQPHNAVLLLCSSHEKGCRPFICDTSYRHSNCFDQYRKSSSAAANLHALLEEQPSELVCPLCRGTVTGWDVLYPARKFLNSKTRSCSLETCSFSGNYAELRKHARLEHPSGRPSEASPNRQAYWTTLEQQRDIEDARVYQSDIEYDLDAWTDWDALVADDFWNARSGLLSLDEWVGDDFWSGGSLFDFPSGISDVEDDLSTLSGLSMPFFSPYFSSPDDDMLDSGNSRSEDDDMMDSGNSRSGAGGDRSQWATVSGLRLNVHLGNVAPSSGSGPTYHSEDDANVSRPRSSYQREADSSNSRSRSGHHRENVGTISSNRSSYRRADDPASSRASYSRSNNSNASRSRSRYYREIDHGNSRRRSSYSREREQRDSRSRFHGNRDFTRSFRGSSRQQPPSETGGRRD
ncbi:uncharacterized protein LOC130992136 [Salvia miltiorrhiza]|uniref:uncharacterized protein LOC130992136 n=1 Tax=Salvia miltiorrhiza TaxID=226208 RepID=UPI0025AC5B4E|nr:uncharacterized protein LOC130992136 [Salvia miltiorrhiza]XP_057772643.1 uncharacterized protein LOC130992136 [Salvia miltiorrhiza]